MATDDAVTATNTGAAALAPRIAAATLAHGRSDIGSRAVAHYLSADLAARVSRNATAGRLDLAALVLTVAMSGAARGADGVNAARRALDEGRAHLEPSGVAGVYPSGAVTAADVLALGAALAAVYAPATVSAMLSAVCAVLRLSVAFGEADADAATATAAIKRPRDSREHPAPRRSTAHAGDPATRAALWRAIDADTMPARRARYRALLAMLYGAGLRRAEAADVLTGGRLGASPLPLAFRLCLTTCEARSSRLPSRRGRANFPRRHIWRGMRR